MESNPAKRLWYVLLVIPILTGLWWSIDFLLRRDRFRDWPQKATSLRKNLSWLFAITAIVCLQISLSSIVRHLRGHTFGLSHLLIPAVLMPPAILSGMTWWTVFRAKPSARGWGIAASLVYVLFAFWPFILLSRSGLAMPVGWSNLAFMLAVGGAGLAAFSRPFTPPAGAPSQLRNPGDGTRVFFDKVVILLIFVSSFLAYRWWVGWLRATGIASGHSSDSRLLTSLLVLLVIITLHELGHTVAGLGFGMKLRAFFVGPFQWWIREGKWEFQFKPTKILEGGGATGLVPATSTPHRWRDLCVIAAGPLVTLVTGGGAMWITLKVRIDSPLQVQGVMALAGAWSLIGGVSNLLPFRITDSYSDGAQILQVLSNGPWGDFHRVVAVIGSSLVTPLRPRDYDIETIQRLAQSITQGVQALLLRLHASSYFIDQGRPSEAAQALKQAELVYDRSASTIPAELLTVFVFGNAYLLRDATKAREWWTRMEAKKPTRFNVDYWRAASALHWIEGNLREANEAWEKSNALAQQLPQAGAYEFDRYECALLRKAIDEVATAGASSA
jgi:hypothetical protein